MPGGQAVVARATAAVFVDGRRAGSAVLVAPRYLVTAAHVLPRLGLGAGARVPVDQVELEFPGQGMGGQAGRATASRLGLSPASAGVDVAVLDLGEDPPSWLPAAVPVWPAARPPGRVQVFGYPLAEGPLCSRPAGPLTPGRLARKARTRACRTYGSRLGRGGFDKGTLAAALIGQTRAGGKPAQSAHKRTGRRPLSNPPLRRRGLTARRALSACKAQPLPSRMY